MSEKYFRYIFATISILIRVCVFSLLLMKQRPYILSVFSFIGKQYDCTFTYKIMIHSLHVLRHLDTLIFWSIKFEREILNTSIWYLTFHRPGPIWRRKWQMQNIIFIRHWLIEILFIHLGIMCFEKKNNIRSDWSICGCVKNSSLGIERSKLRVNTCWSPKSFDFWYLSSFLNNQYGYTNKYFVAVHEVWCLWS